MASPIHYSTSIAMDSIPLLDASDLPAADDWALLEALHADGDIAADVDPDFDRFARLRLSAKFDD